MNRVITGGRSKIKRKFLVIQSGEVECKYQILKFPEKREKLKKLERRRISFQSDLKD